MVTSVVHPSCVNPNVAPEMAWSGIIPHTQGSLENYIQPAIEIKKIGNFALK